MSGGEGAPAMRLHGYFRSTASWRVRIALNLKGLQAEAVAHHLRRGEQRAEAYRRLNPQGLVPTLESGNGRIITQSLAIIEWLEETHPTPTLLPGTSLERARVRAFALAIACDIHPVQNLKVLVRLRALGIAEPPANRSPPSPLRSRSASRTRSSRAPGSGARDCRAHGGWRSFVTCHAMSTGAQNRELSWLTAIP